MNFKPELAPAAVELQGIRLTYPARRRREAAHEALRGVDLTVPAGQSIALLGPNGSGKSTLMRIICGMAPADAGEVRVFGARDISERRRRLSVVFQTSSLDPHLTVLENLRCQASLYGMNGRAARERRIAAELDRARLSDRANSLVKELSGGLARRVDLARAMLHEPDLLLLDEPTVGLDPAARPAFLDHLDERRAERGLTILLTTHLIDEAERCDRVVFIDRGRIVADGAPGELRRRMGEAVFTVSAGENPASIAGLDRDDVSWRPTGAGRGESAAWIGTLATAHATSINTGAAARPAESSGGGGDSRDVAPNENRAAEIAAHLAAAGRSFTFAPPTLADAFIQLTGRSLRSSDRDEVAASQKRT